MTKQNLIIRPGLTAIAAFAALGATPLLAQAADPLAATSDSAPIVATTPVIAAPDVSAVPTADPLAPAAKARPTATKTTAAKASRPAARSVTKTVARAVAPVAAATPVAPVAPAVPEAPIASAPAPLPVEAPVAAAPAPVAQTASGLPADALPIGAAGLGALALAGAALAMRRRKRRMTDDEFVTTYDEPAFAAPAPMMAAPEPVIAERTPMVAAKPVMAWGSTAPAATATVGDGEVPEGIDPDSHVAAAYRGPTAENPSLSLKTRLKRAAFFDQRERQAAAGEAAPLDMTAGLPDAVVDETSDSPNVAAPHLAPAPTSTGGSFTMRPTLQSA